MTYFLEAAYSEFVPVVTYCAIVAFNSVGLIFESVVLYGDVVECVRAVVRTYSGVIVVNNLCKSSVEVSNPVGVLLVVSGNIAIFAFNSYSFNIFVNIGGNILVSVDCDLAEYVAFAFVAAGGEERSVDSLPIRRGSAFYSLSTVRSQKLSLPACFRRLRRRLL